MTSPSSGSGSGLLDLPDRKQGYVDLRSYVAVGDGRTVALIAHDGSIDWYPVQDMNSTPIFARLLDAANGGAIELCPREAYQVVRSYIPGTNVLQTTYTTASGRVCVTDSVNMGGTGPLPWGELARRIEGLAGDVAMVWCVTPGTAFSTVSPWVEDNRNGTVLHVGDVTLAVCNLDAGDVDIRERSVRGEFHTTTGSQHLVSVVSSRGEPLRMPNPQRILDNIEHSIDHWRRWSGQFSYHGRWRDAALRSALALKLLLHGPSGAMMAAATTSLPENPAGTRNWDYRFSWLRDATYSLHNLIRLGDFEDVHANVSWLLRIARKHGAVLPVLTTLDGSQPRKTKTEYASGWRGIGPVITGNEAANQLQLGVYGDLLNIVQLYMDDGNVLDIATRRMLADVADRTCDIWQMPDAGMWELEHIRHYTTSKMGCWHALNCAIRLSETGHIPGNVVRWQREQDRIKDWVETYCWSEARQSYVWYPGTEKLDTSVTLHAMTGFERGPRMSATLDALQAELGRGPLIYRFSGCEDEEKTFVACAFWMAAALACVGRKDEAEAQMNDLIPRANDVGLFSEMIDEVDGSFWGNLPQALSHLALMTAAVTFSEIYGDHVRQGGQRE